jgi:hypothetical protein
MLELSRTRNVTLVWLSTLVLFATLGCNREPGPPSRWQTWRTLRLEANASMIVSGKVELTRRETGSGLQLETWATATALGQLVEDSRTLTSFDTGGRALRFARQSRSGGRRYVFGERGYTVEKLDRPDGQNRSLDEWTVTSSNEFAYPPAAVGAEPPRVFDYFGMLLELKNAGLDAPGDEATLHVATSDGPRAFRIAVSESREGERTFTDLDSGTAQTLWVHEFRLRVSPADRDSDEGFLRMEGETEIWVESESMTPLEISGKVPRVPGRVELRLVGMS